MRVWICKSIHSVVQITNVLIRILDCIGSPNVSAAVAFAIGVFIQLIEKLLVTLKDHSQLRQVLPRVVKLEPKNVDEADTATVTLRGSTPPPPPVEEPVKTNTADRKSRVQKNSKAVNRRQRKRRFPNSKTVLGFSSSDESEDSDDSDFQRRRKGHGGKCKFHLPDQNRGCQYSV